MTTERLIEEFRNKGGARQGQGKAYQILRKLKSRLKEDDYKRLEIAHNHYGIGEGAEELYDVCKQLLKQYK